MELVGKSAVYVDSIDQAITIGECQHAYNQGILTPSSIRGTLGELITCNVPGRSSAEEITLFDGTGVALQDLSVAELAVRRAKERGLAIDYDY